MSKILIIEDEEAIADLEKDYLELSGFEVEIENRGDVGLKRALETDYDLFILDLMLPEMDGFEICKEIRNHKNTPIIMVSAKKDDIDKIRGLGLGADDYMTKPFSPSELVARVKAHMARYDRLVGSNAQKNDIIEIRGIKIDKTARRVWVDGGEKNFTTKEFDLLTRSTEYSSGFSICRYCISLPCGKSEPCIYEGRALPGDLGYGVRRRYRHRHRTYQEDPREDREKHRQTPVHRDDLGRGISV